MSIISFSELDHPCKYKKTSEMNDYKTNLILLIRRNLLTYEENKEEFCLENPDYNADIIPIKEYFFVFVCSSILEVIFLVLLYFWYNDFRRIKYLTDGKLVGSNTKDYGKYNIKKSNFNNNNNHIIYKHNDYIVNYDIFGRPIFNVKSNKINVVVKNNKQYFPNKKYYVRTKDANNNKNNIKKEIIKFENKDKKDNEKISNLENNDDMMDIFNLNLNKNKRINMKMNKSSSITNINENSVYNSDKSPIN